MIDRNTYGKELIIDMAECDVSKFNRTDISWFFDELCRRIDMEPADVHFWDDVGVAEDERQTEPHLKGTSAIQFITTSNITIHALDLLGNVYVNVFSCKDFEEQVAVDVALELFSGTVMQTQIVWRYR